MTIFFNKGIPFVSQFLEYVLKYFIKVYNLKSTYSPCPHFKHLLLSYLLRTGYLKMVEISKLLALYVC